SPHQNGVAGQGALLARGPKHHLTLNTVTPSLVEEFTARGSPLGRGPSARKRVFRARSCAVSARLKSWSRAAPPMPVPSSMICRAAGRPPFLRSTKESPGVTTQRLGGKQYRPARVRLRDTNTRRQRGGNRLQPPLRSAPEPYTASPNWIATGT